MSFVNGPNIGAAENVIQRRSWNWLVEAFSGSPPPPVMSTTFVAARINGGGKYSLDGLTWTDFDFPSSANMSGVAQNADGFIAFPFGGTQTYISTDGITWDVGGVMPSSANWFGAVWNGSQWLAYGDNAGNSRIATSPDGLNWTAATNLSQTGSVVWDGSQYVALIGNSPYIYTSPDAALWTAIATNIDAITIDAFPANIHFFDSTFFLSGEYVANDFSSFWMLESADGITWSIPAGSIAAEVAGRFADNGVDTLVCTSLFSSAVFTRVAGIWNTVGIPANPLFLTAGDVHFKQGLFALVASYGTTYSSADGLTWADVAAAGPVNNWLCVI